MTKIDKAVEVIRKMSDDDIKKLLLHRCPRAVGLPEHAECCGYFVADCNECWNEEVEE